MSAHTVKVVLVGSGARNAAILQDHLQRQGCVVFFATSLKEANEMLSGRRFDLILSEFLLSDGTAYQLLSPLRGTNTTMFFSNAVENGCWWMHALYEGRDRWGEAGMRPVQFRTLLDEYLFDKQMRNMNEPECKPPAHTPTDSALELRKCDPVPIRSRDDRAPIQGQMQRDVVGNDTHRRVFIFLGAVILAIVLAAVFLYAQTETESGPSPYTAATKVTVKGTVEEVRRYSCSRAEMQGRKRHINSHCATTELILKTKDGIVDAQIGPTKFIRDHRFFFADGDQVLVIGSERTGPTSNKLIAEEVVKAKQALTLRDSTGSPLWVKHGQT